MQRTTSTMVKGMTWMIWEMVVAEVVIWVMNFHTSSPFLIVDLKFNFAGEYE